MVRRIERNEVQRLVAEGAQLVEVLPEEEYQYEHIAGAVHIWLRELDDEAPRRLDPKRGVIVYCNDYLCDMSPRGAVRLEQLGFEAVYDYVAGKTDWTAAGLPREGHTSHVLYAGDVADHDVPTCRLDDALGEARRRLEEAGARLCAVIDDDGIVLGSLMAGKLPDLPDDTPVERAMRPGPTTVRANEILSELVERLHRAKVAAILITTPEGRLIGLLDRAVAEHALHEADGD